MTSLKTSIKTITYLSDTGCLEIQGASLHQDNNLLLVVRLRSVHDRFYHFNLVCPLAVICTECDRGNI
ncbi:hypothetical protein B6R84_22995 [Escherichia coli]|nr:hypothetical protein [Escherichia coli]